MGLDMPGASYFPFFTRDPEFIAAFAQYLRIVVETLNELLIRRALLGHDLAQ
jgi:hypothetical protein